MNARPITLSSDFGTSDWYVAAMKGVLASGAPGSPLIDLLHDIPAHDVVAGGFAFAQAVSTFAPESVHLCVVDPGVGSTRRALALQGSNGAYFVGPDNGVLSLAAAPFARAVELPIPADASPTFHGRDVFAPAAARLARGEALDSLGTRVTEIERLPSRWSRAGDDLSAPIVWIDRFGNLISDLPAAELPARCEIRIGTLRLEGLRTHYAEVSVGEALAYVGSAGTLEIALREADAARALGVAQGDPLHVRSR